MLKLENVRKTYTGGGEEVIAMRGMTIEFRANELVSILGPSGCGKTTMLNVIGSLDKYDSGDLIINGTSTKNFKEEDWDAYRNNSVGFVFQNYNLISHQNILQNVELAMTLSGISATERKERATKALQDVGLGDKLDKKPNQLSGGQMQRVAIARALVNNPEIILADEPTGALDSKTSIQIMDILKEVSETRLVIMVTHNPELAEEYSTRIVNLLDGDLQSDSNPLTEAEKKTSASQNTGRKFKKTSMSMLSAMALSFKNLLTKKGRTITTAIAGSIGIIGVGLVLALTGGLTSYMDGLQADSLANFPIVVQESVLGAMNPNGSQDEIDWQPFPEGDTIYRLDQGEFHSHTNDITDEFLTHLEEMETALPDAVNALSFHRNVNMNILVNTDDTVVKFDTTPQGSAPMAPFAGGAQWQEMPDSHDFILSHYELIEGRMPENMNEILLLVDQYNRLEDSFFVNLGMSGSSESFNTSDFLDQTMLRLIDNNDFYQPRGELFVPATPADYGYLFENANGVDLTIVGILRIQETAPEGFSFFTEGFLYTTALTDYVLEQANASDIAMAQADRDTNVFTGLPFENDEIRRMTLLNLGADTMPVSIDIFPTDFDSKDQIMDYLADFNVGLADEDQIIAIDMAEIMVASMVGSSFDVISYVLIGFAAISLVVSTLMIGIITYVSVMERTKEIGILRSIGARKKDISRVFTAETLIVGLTAGTLGVVVAYILSIPLNTLFENLAGISGIVALNPLYAFLLVAGSAVLTTMAGIFPSRTAAKKDPVEALRTE